MYMYAYIECRKAVEKSQAKMTSLTNRRNVIHTTQSSPQNNLTTSTSNPEHGMKCSSFVRMYVHVILVTETRVH